MKTGAGTWRAAVLAVLADLLPHGGLLSAPEDLDAYSRDWSGDHVGTPLAVARPDSVDSVAAVMRCCAELKVPVVPQGGLTGLVGAAVARPDGRELVLSLERLRRIRLVDPIDYAIVVDAGCVLEDAKRAAEEQDCLLPITFGAQGSCRIGGNVATNAGGFNVLRYGMTRDLLLGLEVVLADGRIWDGLKVLRKDNRGVDLKQLFIGSEGTLGVVTAAAFKLFPRPHQIETALLGLRSVEDAMALYARMRRSSSDLLSAFELILRDGIDVALSARPDFAEPMDGRYPVYALVELAASGAVDVRHVLETGLADAADLIADGVVAASHAQGERLWLYRETMVEHQGGGRPYLRTDVSVAIARIPELLASALPAVKNACPGAKVLAYGHVGDGNVHMNVIPPPNLDSEQRSALFHAAEAIIFGVVDVLGGSISAEHGIGRVKQQAYLDRVDPVTLDLQRALKQALDPQGLLSAGRILPAAPERRRWR